MRRFLRSTAIALALSFFLPAPGPVTGIVFNPGAYADPVTGQIPDWIRAACCGPEDAHKLRADQIQRVSEWYWRADGYSRDIANGIVQPSQDENAWVFYATYSNGNQGPIYCAFVPMAF
jgi:hypothetical protein